MGPKIKIIFSLLLLFPFATHAGPFNFYNPFLHNYGLVNYADAASRSGFSNPQVQVVLPSARTEAAASGSDEICLTESCIIQAAHLLEQMDRDVNPCENFYDFACGGFVKKTILPEHKTRTGFHAMKVKGGL